MTNLPPDHWQVPDYQKSIWAPKRSAYCVVIPVINEGERIQALLDRMTQCDISTLADIIIIDGGSTDGSLDPAFLQSKHIRALLLKTGKGKLSAQLRCAYAYAMQEGYEGVVTIDGNNKDDPQAIPAFIEALERGVDFAQGSRFIKGGKAENTPLARDLAIRLLHAPMLSFFSGFRWSDTTQGFRAYSRKLLVDSDVDVFRELFETYELLAYLSYRAPKLGFRCEEIPTSRTYPVGEIPTKISKWKGNWLVLRTLVAACSGAFNPPAGRSNGA